MKPETTTITIELTSNPSVIQMDEIRKQIEGTMRCCMVGGRITVGRTTTVPLTAEEA